MAVGWVESPTVKVVLGDRVSVPTKGLAAVFCPFTTSVPAPSITSAFAVADNAPPTVSVPDW